MDAIASQITSFTIVYSTVYSDTDQRKHQSSASLAFVRGIHKWPVTRKMFPFDDVIIIDSYCSQQVIFQITNPLHNSCVRSEAHFHPDIRLTGIRQGGPFCPACRTTLIATRFWVVMICPIIKCLTVLRVFFYFVWFVFIHHNFQFYFELCTYCDILDIYLS